MGIDLATLMNEAIDTMRAVHKAAKGLQSLCAEQRELVKLSVGQIMAENAADAEAAMRRQATVVEQSREPLPTVDTRPGYIMGAHPLLKDFINAVNNASRKWKNQEGYYEEDIAVDIAKAWRLLADGRTTIGRRIVKELSKQEASN